MNYKGYEIDIQQDEWADNPREWDNLSIILYAHGSYELGDVNLKREYPEADSWNDIEFLIKKNYNPAVMLPIYLYDHSGLYLKIGDFSDQPLPQGHAEFDTGKVGYVIVTKEAIKKEYSLKRVSKKAKNAARELLEAEVETFANFVNGECYCLTVFKDQTQIEAIGGFYDYDDAISEAKEIINFDIKQNRKIKQNKLKAFIKNNVSLQTRQQTFAS